MGLTFVFPDSVDDTVVIARKRNKMLHKKHSCVFLILRVFNLIKCFKKALLFLFIFYLNLKKDKMKSFDPSTKSRKQQLWIEVYIAIDLYLP